MVVPRFTRETMTGYLYRKEVDAKKKAEVSTSKRKAVFTPATPSSMKHESRPISRDDQMRRSLSEKARTVATQIENVSASLSDNESRIAELEVLFGNPNLYDDPDQIASLGKEYRALKKETEALWEEWERLSLEAERIDGDLAGLRAG